MRYAERCLGAATCFCVVFCLVFTGCGGGSSSPATTPGAGSSPSSAAPLISSIAPANVPAGSAAVTLTVNGANFQSDSVIEVAGTKETTSFVNSGELTTTLPANQVASGAELQVLVFNGSVSSSASSGNQVTVTNPAPVVNSLTPSTVGPASSPNIVIAGTGFVPASVLQLNGSARQTSFVSSTQLSLTLTAADLQTPGSDAITAVNTAPGGGTSKAVQLTVSATPPPPPAAPTLSLASVTPTQVAYGSPDTHIFLTGTGFDSSAIANWNGQPLTTALVSATQLAATVPAIDFTQVGNASITVTSTTAQPSPSAAINVQITAPPAPQLTSLYPNSAPMGSAALSIQVNGTGFATNSVVQWNGQNVPTTFGDSTSLTASVPGSLQTAPGNATVTVVTPAPGGGSSQSLPFTEYVGIPNNDGLYNPVDGLVYVSVPSSAGAPLGNSIVSIDPATGSVGQPILVGSEPNHLALSSNGATLFVGLDGAGAVVQVDLPSRTVGASAYLGSKGGIYDPPGTANALAALPGSSTSVAVSSNNSSIYGGGIGIFDNGVVRGNSATVGYPSSVQALVADPSQAVLYGVSGAYGTYTYDQNGVTAGISTALTASASQLQIENGRAYLNSGQVLDAGTGSLLGTFYIAANTAASGPLVADAGSGKVFVLSGTQPYTNSGFTSIQAFRESDFTSVTDGSMPVNVAAPIYGVYSGTSSLWRWGTSGLAFRTANGVYSFRSNIVRDLSQTQADLQVALTVSGPESAGASLNVTASVTNIGPNPATNVSLTGLLPVNTGVASAKASQGYCTPSTTLGCNLGTIPSGASVSVTLALVPYFAGSLDLAVNVVANEADPNQANNSASTSLTIAGSNYEPTPVLQAIAPNSALAGSNETTVTMTGANFSPDSTVLWNGVSIPTVYVNSSTLTATLSTSQLSTFGWVPVAVASPAANGASSQALPFTVYNVVHLSANHILYNPYDRLLYASVNSAATQVTGNSIVTIDPLTGTIGNAVPVGSQPTFMGLSDDGQALYALLSGSNAVALYRPLSQSVAFSFTPTVPAGQTVTIGSPRGVAVMPGTETTIAYDTGDWGGVGIFDIDTGSQSGTLRGRLSGPYTGSGVSFLDANDLYTFDTDTTGDSLDHFVVSASGLSGVNAFSLYESTLFGFGGFATPPSFKIKQGLAFANSGGVANPVTNPATQIGIYQPVSNSYSSAPLVEPDPSLGEVFFFGAANASDQNAAASPGLFRYDQFSFLPTGFLPLANLSTGTNQNTAIDLVRFGTDGLALLTSAGQIYLARGPFITPQLLQQNPTPTLSSASVTSATHGGGNLSLVVTGSNLVAGATVDWNGSPRTTTRVDGTHLSVAIPASDLAAAGTASITITNPATAASNEVSFTIN